jgi:hypothetical protein
MVTTLEICCVCEPPEDGGQTGPKHVVWEVHNKSSTKKYFVAYGGYSNI